MKHTLLLTVMWSTVGGLGTAMSDEVVVPRVLDDRLQLSLLAREPEIVTPTGLAADRQGRLYVVESHTHLRGQQYKGPKNDRVVVFEDSDGDGLLDRSRTYAAGLRHALAIAFSGSDELYAVQMKSVVALRDLDRDGRCETQTPVLTVKTENSNNHGVLLGLVFDNQNRMYVSLGNIGGSTYSIQGSDGSEVAGHGDTGLIVRSDADGSRLERYAMGFWNPPEMKFDSFGRLLATDNDPDARGPNRVLHVIQGGDYGYKARFGSSGLHPYCAWNGELPGTLPMVAGVGEAPVGLLDCAASSLPLDYANDLLVGVWGTNEVVRVRTKQRDASLEGQAEPLLVGDANFRPATITTTSDGTVYIADWADRQYSVHGKGRIWRLTAKPDVKMLHPVLPFAKVGTDEAATRLMALKNADNLEAFDELVDAAIESDPFVASTAISSLSQPVFQDRLIQLLDGGDASRRLVALLAFKQSGMALTKERLQRLLNDQDLRIRQLAMIVVGESQRADLGQELKRSLSVQTASAELFETFLATLHLLSAAAGNRNKSATGADSYLVVDQQLLLTILADAAQPTTAKAMAVRYLKNIDDASTLPLVMTLAHASDRDLAVEAVRALADSSLAMVSTLLGQIAHNTNKDVDVRCAAIMSFVSSESRKPDDLQALLQDANPRVAIAAARGLTRYAGTEAVQMAFELAKVRTDSHPSPSVFIDQLRFALKLDAAERPQTEAQWKQAIADGGDADAGKRVFFDQRVSCAKCHSVEGRGGRIGPNLSNIAAAKTRDQILNSILHPSADKSPDFQGYFVVMQDGRTYKGTQFHFRGESAEMLLEDGGQLRFKLSDTEEYGPLDVSLMPETLVEAMSVSELRDLIAFLSSRGV